MKKSLLFMLIFAVVALSSCKKENPTNPAAGKTYSAEEMKTLLGSPEYLPNAETTLAMWKEKNKNGFKSEPIVSMRFGYPSDYFTQLENGNFNQLLDYFIIFSGGGFSDSLYDWGRIRTEYNNQAEIVGKPELLLGWEGNDCVLVTINCSNQNTENILLTFTCTTNAGEISFKKKYIEIISLPKMNFKLMAEMLGSILAETHEFNPGTTDNINIDILPNQNGTYIINYYLPQSINGGDEIVFEIHGERYNSPIQILPIVIAQQPPLTIQFGTDFTPDQVDILIKHVNDETHVIIEEKLPPQRAEKSPSGDNYTIVELINIDEYRNFVDEKAKEIYKIDSLFISYINNGPPSNINGVINNLYNNYYSDLVLVNDSIQSIVYEKLVCSQKFEFISHLSNLGTKSLFCKIHLVVLVDTYQIPMPENWLMEIESLNNSVYDLIQELMQ